MMKLGLGQIRIGGGQVFSTTRFVTPYSSRFVTPYSIPYTVPYYYQPAVQRPAAACGVNVNLSRADLDAVRRGGAINASGTNQCGQAINISVRLRSDSTVSGMGACPVLEQLARNATTKRRDRYGCPDRDMYGQLTPNGCR